MSRQRLPIGIQDFPTIRSEGFYYVDKTPFIRRLVEEGRHYFLSRPRRFGKSLLVDTLRSLFEGEEDLFRGLDICPHWDWSAQHPVVRLSFGKSYERPEDIERHVVSQLGNIEHSAGLESDRDVNTGPERLQNLLYRLHHATGRRAAVLVDEYDKPILDRLHKPDQAEANRDYLRGLYGIIKDSARNVRFVFVTGISMFSKVSLFSGLNNLEDISLDPRFAAICGYREEDLDRVFGPELEGLDRDEIRAWYNGYSWRGPERVYNPFDVLLLLRGREFFPHWFETGSPDFLYQTLTKTSVSPTELEGRLAERPQISKFDVKDIDVRALLFQSGYLTIAEEVKDGCETLFRLDYPNREVRESLSRGLLAWLDKRGVRPRARGRELCGLLEANDFAGFAGALSAWFPDIPYQWHTNNDLARYEAWYASLVYFALRAAGADLRAEESSSRGRPDMTLHLGGQIFLFEFKVTEDAAGGAAALDAAMAQMRERGYADKHRGHDGPVHLIGIACGRKERNVLGIRSERA